jgi:formate hydrogenlyase subunit 6/NADH:ubiquinone oxidoreductase subunit I
VRCEIAGDSPNLPDAAAICPTAAIVQRSAAGESASGGARYVIDQGLCIRCDACRELAPDAVRVVDAVAQVAVPVSE